MVTEQAGPGSSLQAALDQRQVGVQQVADVPICAVVMLVAGAMISAELRIDQVSSLFGRRLLLAVFAALLFALHLRRLQGRAADGSAEPALVGGLTPAEG